MWLYTQTQVTKHCEYSVYDESVLPTFGYHIQDIITRNSLQTMKNTLGRGQGNAHGHNKTSTIVYICKSQMLLPFYIKNNNRMDFDAVDLMIN